MQVVNSWAIFAGIAALGLPLIVHWLTRPRPQRMNLSTIRFVAELIHQRRAAHRLRDLLVLLARVLAVVCLALAFARPKGEPESLISPEATGNTVRIVILDESQSMAAVIGGVSTFERARALAGKYLEYQNGVQANLLLAGATCRPLFDRPSTNFSTLREQLSQTSAKPQRLNAQAAINSAAEILQKVEDNGARRELLIIADFQRSNWSSVDLSVLPADVAVSMQTPVEGPGPANLGITAIRTLGRAEEGQTIRVQVEVGNYSEAGREVDIELTLDSQLQHLRAFCPPGTTTAIPTQITLAKSGWQWGEAKLVANHDSLPLDDSRPFVVQVQRSPVYLLATRQSAKPQASSSHYLERALSPYIGQSSHERVTRIDPLNLSLEKLATADLLVLDHPGNLTDEQIQWLAGLLRRGRGILYVACEPADAVNLKRLAQTAGTDLHMPVEFGPAPSGSSAVPVFWSQYNKEYPAFKSFGDSMQRASSELRFASHLVSRRLENGVDSDVIVSYNDLSAALIRTTCGAGMLAVLNADLSASNLPSSPLFVAVVTEAATKLVQQRRSPDLDSGEPAAAWLPMDQAQILGLKVRGPADAEDEAGLFVQDGQQIAWRCSAIPRPGIYQIARNQEVVFAAAAGLPAEESDLATLDGQVLTKRLAVGRSAEFRHAQQQQEQREWWPWVLAACVILMTAEWGVLRVFKS